MSPPPAGRRSLKVLKWLGVAAAIGAAPVFGLHRAERTEAARMGGMTPAEAPTHSALPASAPIIEPLAPTDFVGVLLPRNMADVAPKAEGRVLEVRVRLGQPVKKGQSLIALDPRDRRQALAMAQASLRGAQAALANARSATAAARVHTKATTALHAKAVVGAEEAAQAEFDLQMAIAKMASARAQVVEEDAHVGQLRVALDETELFAPFDGLISAIHVEPGANVRAGDPAVRVVGGEGLRVRIAVPEESTRVLTGSLQARLALADRTLMATIDRVAPEVEPASRTFLVEGTIDDPARACAGDCTMLAGRAVRAILAPAQIVPSPLQ